MQRDTLCHVAVSSATYAIDKPYTYLLPETFFGPGPARHAGYRSIRHWKPAGGGTDP